ncbi:hypothetical protein, partial [Escherichia coli]
DKGGRDQMCIFDVHYQINDRKYTKSYLLALVEDGFQLRKNIQHVLFKEHQQEITILSTDLEELDLVAS